MADKFDLRTLFSFRGRAGRREFWRLMLALIALSFGLSLLGAVPGGQIIGIPFSLAGNIAQWAVVARRLHDLGRSGWWQVPAMALGAAALVRAVQLGPAAVEANPGLAGALLGAMLLSMAFLVVIGVVRGDPGPNRFGQPPA